MSTSLTRTYERLLTTTSDILHKGGSVIDQWSLANPVVHTLLGKKNGVKTKAIENGGYFIRVNMVYEKNGNGGSFGTYDLLDDTPQDGMTAAFYPWSHYNWTDMLDGASMFKNSGKARIVDEWLEIKNQTRMTMFQDMNEDLLDIAGVTLSTDTSGNSGKNIKSLPMLIQNDPTQSYTLAQVNQSTGADGTWRNQYKSSTATTGAGLYDELLNFKMSAEAYAGGPYDVYVADQVTFEKYVAYMNERIQYRYSDKADVGFPEGVRLFGKTLFWDALMPDTENSTNGSAGSALTAGTIFGLNTNFLSLIVGKGFDFAPQGVRKAERQDAYREFNFFRGQLVTNARRKQGVLYGISPSIDPRG